MPRLEGFQFVSGGVCGAGRCLLAAATAKAVSRAFLPRVALDVSHVLDTTTFFRDDDTILLQQQYLPLVLLLLYLSRESVCLSLVF